MNPNLSFWERESFFAGIDVAIIGSGLVGLSAALHLKEKQPNWQIAIFERGSIPTGASTRNAGFACFGSLTELIDDLKANNETEVFDLVAKRWEGLQRLRERVGDHQMDFHENGNYELFKKEEQTSFEECRDKLDYFNEHVGKAIGRKSVYQIANEEIPSFGFRQINHLIKNNFEGQINTGKMMSRLLHLAKTCPGRASGAKGIRIFNGISIAKMEDASNQISLLTENGWEISASKVLVCTNGFSKSLLPDLDITPARNQVLITKPIADLKVKGCFHYDKGYVYFRNVGNRVLLGGARNQSSEIESTEQFGTSSLIQNHLEEILRTVILPEQSVEIDTWWSGILGVGAVKTPIVKMVSKNIGVAVRMGGMGVAIGSLIGEEGAELLL